jgi:hypothetical protein
MRLLASAVAYFFSRGKETPLFDSFDSKDLGLGGLEGFLVREWRDFRSDSGENASVFGKGTRGGKGIGARIYFTPNRGREKGSGECGFIFRQIVGAEGSRVGESDSFLAKCVGG